jgi:hypothetical protein
VFLPFSKQSIVPGKVIKWFKFPAMGTLFHLNSKGVDTAVDTVKKKKPRFLRAFLE